MDRDSGGKAGCRVSIQLHCPDRLPRLTVLKLVHFKSIRQSSSMLNFDSIWAATPLLNHQSNLFLFSGNCAALFESCVGKRCCGNYELAIPGPGILMTQAPPGTRIKCSAASLSSNPQRHDRIVYTKASLYDGVHDARYYNRKSLMNRYCLPRTILKHGK